MSWPTSPTVASPTPRRIISATCGVRVSSVYVPNGRSLDHEHYQYKLRWLARLRAHVAAQSTPADAVVVTGDFNIAPTDLDVYDPKKFVGATHVSPEARRTRRPCEWGMSDLFRQHHPEGKLYSWWDYRAGDFHMGRGLRIDLVLGTRPVAERCTFSIVDRNARKGQSPSDHAPVLIDTDWP
jgi:exodeoxyribonuclease-3